MEEIWETIDLNDFPLLPKDSFFISSYGRFKSFLPVNQYGTLKENFPIFDRRQGFNIAIFRSKRKPLLHLRVDFLVASAFIDNPLQSTYVLHKDGDLFNDNVNNLIWDERYSLIDLINEEWRSVENTTNYFISNYGRLKVKKKYKNSEFERFEIQLGWHTKQGYIATEIENKTHFIHQLVARAFIPNPLNFETINHKDFNKINNCVENLEWMTRKDNSKDAHAKGRFLEHYKRFKGQNNPKAKLVPDEILEIKHLYFNEGLEQKAIAQKFNICQSNVSAIIVGKNWKDIT